MLVVDRTDDRLKNRKEQCCNADRTERDERVAATRSGSGYSMSIGPYRNEHARGKNGKIEPDRSGR